MCWGFENLYMVSQRIVWHFSKASGLLDLYDQRRAEARSFPETQAMVQWVQLEEDKTAEGFFPHCFDGGATHMAGAQRLYWRAMGTRYQSQSCALAQKGVPTETKVSSALGRGENFAQASCDQGDERVWHFFSPEVAKIFTRSEPSRTCMGVGRRRASQNQQSW